MTPWIRLTATCAMLGGCASVQRPPGGPDDKEPPEIIGMSIDTNATSVSVGKLDVRFNEMISERPAGGSVGSGPVTLAAVVLVSPQTGSPKVQWHRDHITIEPRGGFRKNTTYRVTLLPGIADNRGNLLKESTSIVFSTGPTILPFSILGRVFDWQSNTPAGAAIVEAVANAGTRDSLTYLAIADNGGQFDLGPLGPGKYLVRTFIDTDRNRERGLLEKWDSLTVDVTDHRPSIELRAIQRDTAVIGIQRVEVLDSLWIRIQLDKPFDARTNLQPTLVTLKRADSTETQIAAVMTEEQATFLRPRGDSAGRAPIPDRPNPTSLVDPPTTTAPTARPAIPPPLNAIVLRLAPTRPVRAGEKYRVTIRGIRNLLGATAPADIVFEVPKPAAVKPPE